MKRTSSAAFTPAPQETLPLVSNLISLFVGLNPVQFQCLQDDRPILPDPYSERFGLRSDPIKASERAHYFMSWTQENHIKKYMICQTHLGYWLYVPYGEQHSPERRWLRSLSPWLFPLVWTTPQAPLRQRPMEQRVLDLQLR